jgi:hypothetical protein
VLSTYEEAGDEEEEEEAAAHDDALPSPLQINQPISQSVQLSHDDTHSSEIKSACKN